MHTAKKSNFSALQKLIEIPTDGNLNFNAFTPKPILNIHSYYTYNNTYINEEDRK